VNAQYSKHSGSRKNVGRNSSVGIAIRYGLDDSGIEFQWGRDFRLCSDGLWGPPNLLHNGNRVSLPEVNRPWRGVNHQSTNSAEVRERAEP